MKISVNAALLVISLLAYDNLAVAQLNAFGYSSESRIRQPRHNGLAYGYGNMYHHDHHQNPRHNRHHHGHHRNNKAWPFNSANDSFMGITAPTQNASLEEYYDTQPPKRRWGQRFHFQPFVQHTNKYQATTAQPPKHGNDKLREQKRQFKKQMREFEKTLGQWMETIDVINRFRTHFGFKDLAWSNNLANQISEDEMERTHFPSIQLQRPSIYDEINMIRTIRQLIQKMMSEKRLQCEQSGFCKPKVNDNLDWPWGLIDARAGQIGCRCRMNAISQSLLNVEIACKTDTATDKNTNLFFLNLLKDRKTRSKLLHSIHHKQPTVTLEPVQSTNNMAPIASIQSSNNAAPTTSNQSINNVTKIMSGQPTNNVAPTEELTLIDLTKLKSSSSSSSSSSSPSFSSSSSSSSSEEKLDLSLDAEDYNNIDFDVLNDFDVINDTDNSNINSFARAEEKKEGNVITLAPTNNVANQVPTSGINLKTITPPAILPAQSTFVSPKPVQNVNSPRLRSAIGLLTIQSNIRRNATFPEADIDSSSSDEDDSSSTDDDESSSSSESKSKGKKKNHHHKKRHHRRH